MVTPELGTDGEAWLRRLVTELLDNHHLESIVHHTDERILRDVPELDTRVLRANLHAGSVALGRVMLPGLVTGIAPNEIPDEAHVLAESLELHGLDLRVLLRVCRSGQQAMISALTERIGQSGLEPGLTRELVRHAAACITDWSGTTAENLSGIFATERDCDLAGRFARRRETVRAIVSGAPIDPAVARNRLGYALDDTHLAFVLWFDDDTAGDTADLERTAHRMAQRLGARGCVVLACGHRALWVWVRTGRRATVEMSVIAAAESARAAFGLPAPGVAGFRRSHLEALAAQKMQRVIANPGRVVLYESVELDYLISQDEEALGAFISRELGALLGPDAATARLRETLGCYLDLMCSVEATARELGVHRNTVRYRLARIAQQLGHPIEDRRLELDLALRCAISLGAQNGGASRMDG